MAHRKRTAGVKASKTTAASPKLPPLKPRQAAFVREYVANGCGNAKQAAIRAGYAGGASAEVQASRLLRNPTIAAEIEKAQGRLFNREETYRDRMLRELENIAYADLTKCFDANWRLLPLHRIPAKVRRAVVFHFRAGVVTGVSKRNDLAALTLLARCLGLIHKPLPPRTDTGTDTKISIEQLRRWAAEANRWAAEANQSDDEPEMEDPEETEPLNP